MYIVTLFLYRGVCEELTCAGERPGWQVRHESSLTSGTAGSRLGGGEGSCDRVTSWVPMGVRSLFLVFVFSRHAGDGMLQYLNVSRGGLIALWFQAAVRTCFNWEGCLVHFESFKLVRMIPPRVF